MPRKLEDFLDILRLEEHLANEPQRSQGRFLIYCVTFVSLALLQQPAQILLYYKADYPGVNPVLDINTGLAEAGTYERSVE